MIPLLRTHGEARESDGSISMTVILRRPRFSAGIMGSRSASQIPKFQRAGHASILGQVQGGHFPFSCSPASLAHHPSQHRRYYHGVVGVCWKGLTASAKFCKKKAEIATDSFCNLSYVILFVFLKNLPFVFPLLLLFAYPILSQIGPNANTKTITCQRYITASLSDDTTGRGSTIPMVRLGT